MWFVLAQEIASRIESEARLERYAEAAELAQAERTGLTVTAFARALIGQRIDMVVGTERLRARVQICGSDWFLVDTPGAEHIVRSAAVSLIYDAYLAREDPGGIPFTLSSMLRELNGAAVRVSSSAGVFAGEIQGVGADHLILGLRNSGYGSHAPSWQANYRLSQEEAPSLLIAYSAIHRISQEKVNSSAAEVV